jgi:hypothetical protein
MVAKKTKNKKKAPVVVKSVVDTVTESIPLTVSKPDIGILHNRNNFSVMVKYNNSNIQVPPKGVAKKIDKSKIQMVLPEGITFIGGC